MTHSRLRARIEAFLDKQDIAETMYRWGYAADRADWTELERVTAPDLRAEMWLGSVNVVNVDGRELYIEQAKAFFANGLTNSVHSYVPSFAISLDGKGAHARWAGHIANLFGDEALPEVGEGLADAWFERSDESPTGWKGNKIVFQYTWGVTHIKAMMGL